MSTASEKIVASIVNYPELTVCKDDSKFSYCINGSTFFRENSRWKKIGVSHYIGKEYLVKEMIGWHEIDRDELHDICFKSLSLIESFAECLAETLDSIEILWSDFLKERQSAREESMARIELSRQSLYSCSPPVDVGYSAKGFVYLIRHKNGLVKIGFSIHPKAREKTLQAEDPRLHLFAKKSATMRLEKQIQDICKDFRVRGEWFALTENQISWITIILGFETISN